MLIPRFTVRQLLLITTACALAALFVSLSLEHHAWALALALAMGSLAAATTLSALLFLVAWCISVVADELAAVFSTGKSGRRDSHPSGDNASRRPDV